MNGNEDEYRRQAADAERQARSAKKKAWPRREVTDHSAGWACCTSARRAMN